MNRKMFVSSGVVLLAILAVWLYGPPSVSQSLSDQSTKVTQDSTKKTVESTVAADGDSARAGSEGSPRIFFPDTLYDFGSVSQGTSVSHRFVVCNTGDAPLKLIRAKGS